jgi:hypothetical protein
VSRARRAAPAWGLALAGTLLFPGAARACAVCAGRDEAVGWVMFVASLALSVLPLALIGAGVWSLRRRARQIAAAEAARLGAAAPRAASPSVRTA